MSDDEVRLFHNVFPFTSPPRIVVGGKLSEYLKPDTIRLTDTTLRDGQQGWRNFTVDECLRIYEVLHELGGKGAIVSTELFLYTPKDREVAKRIMDLGYEYPRPIAWIRSALEDLRLVLETRIDQIVVLTSISDYQIKFKLGITRSKAFDKYLMVIEEALKRGIEVTATLEDATRADLSKNILPFVSKLMRLSSKYGLPVRVKIDDTLGVGLPYPEIPPPRGIPALIRAVINEGVPNEYIEFHGHNDLGLAVANHLAAWLYGASLSNCTLLGIGERAGNCPLEVMLIHYVGIRGDDGTANLKAIPKVASLMRSMGLKIPEFYPLVGENAFKTKAGINIDGLLKNPEVYLPFNPEEVLGTPYTVAITPYSGRAAVALWINAHVSKYLGGNGFKVSKDDPRVKAIHWEIIRLFEKKQRREPLTDEEMFRLVRKYFSIKEMQQMK